MKPTIATILTAMTLAMALATRPARAEHAKITLDVVAPSGQQTAHMDQTPPDWGKNPRPVLKAKAGDPIKIQWMFVNIYPHKTLENVVVHFFVVREAKVGQKELPELNGATSCSSPPSTWTSSPAARPASGRCCGSTRPAST